MAEFPADGLALPHLLVVSDIDRSRDWYQDVLGAEICRQYGSTSAVLSFLDTTPTATYPRSRGADRQQVGRGGELPPGLVYHLGPTCTHK